MTIFQCITMEGWTKIMNIYQDAYMAAFVVAYFMLCIIICSVFLLNLTIAVMLMKYEELDKEQETGDANVGKKAGDDTPVRKADHHNTELRSIGRQAKLPKALTEFLIEQGSIQIQEGAQKLLKAEDSFFKQLMASKNNAVDVSHPYYRNGFVRWCFEVIDNPRFDPFILFVIVLNTFTLALDKHPQFNDTLLEALGYINYCFTAIFTAEVVLKVIGLGLFAFFRDSMNQFDCLIVVISIAELFQTGPGVFSAFRAVRLFKIFKYFQSGDLKILIDSITFTLTTIGDYVILLLLFIYVFALLGMSMFAGKIKFDENDKVVHTELVPEIAQEPDYDAALSAAG